MNKWYTGVGSRETPKEMEDFMQEVGFILAKKGFILRSGCADRADTYFEIGALKYKVRGLKQRLDIYLPWDGFNKQYKDENHFIATEFDNYEDAWEMASETHPAWDRCSAGAQALHARNCYQVLGHDLATPSKFLICWAKTTKSGNIAGGTATAWNLAKSYNIPCFNLFVEEDYKRVSKLLEN